MSNKVCWDEIKVHLRILLKEEEFTVQEFYQAVNKMAQTVVQERKEELKDEAGRLNMPI